MNINTVHLEQRIQKCADVSLLSKFRVSSGEPLTLISLKWFVLLVLYTEISLSVGKELKVQTSM